MTELCRARTGLVGCAASPIMTTLLLCQVGSSGRSYKPNWICQVSERDAPSDDHTHPNDLGTVSHHVAYSEVPVDEVTLLEFVGGGLIECSPILFRFRFQHCGAVRRQVVMETHIYTGKRLHLRPHDGIVG